LQLVARQHSSPEEFEALHQEWNELLDRSASRSVFLTWEWQLGCWRHFGEGHHLLLFSVREDDGSLAGIAPLRVRRDGQLLSARAVTFLGATRASSDYLDLIAARGREEAVASAVWDALLARAGDWDYLELSDVPDESIAARHLVRLAEQHGCFVDRVHCQNCPFLPLAADLDGYWKSLGPAMRASVRRKSRKLEDLGIAYRTISDPEALPAALETLYDLHAKRWAVRDQSGKFRDPAVHEFHLWIARTLGAGGSVRVSSLARGEQIIATLYSFEFKRVFTYYQSGFDPRVPGPGLRPGDYSPGSVLISHCVQDAIGRGMVEFDFLRGVEEYKLRWTSELRVTWTYTALPRSKWVARGRHRFDRLLRETKRHVRRILPGLRPSA
jgi:CelD/BcsL family acetyltransferase involved in cellulose biosynthesis